MTFSRSRLRRSLTGAVLAILVTVGFAACTQDANRKDPTIGGGVNMEVGEQPVKLLNLMVITTEGTTGFLEGALSSTGPDTLTSVSGVLIGPDNEPSGQPVAFDGGPAEVVPSVMTQLAEGSPFTAETEMPAGMTMRMTLVLSEAGEVTLDVPIIDGNNVDYREATPRPDVAEDSDLANEG